MAKTEREQWNQKAKLDFYHCLWRGITANKVKMCDDISNFSDDICNLYYDTYILTDENYNLHDC